MLTPQSRLWLSVGVTALCCSPALAILGGKTQAGWQTKERLEQAAQQLQEDSDIAMQRAKRCLLMDVATPLSDNGYAHYWQQPNRPLPSGTVICDSFGNTGLVAAKGRVYDVRSASPEALNKVLADRGQKNTNPDPINNPRK